MGIEVSVKQKAAEIHFDSSTQIYFLVERVSGEFGTGVGEEFTDSDPNDPQEGIYIPIWMPIEELPLHDKIFPVALAGLVLRSQTKGWDGEAAVIHENTN